MTINNIIKRNGNKVEFERAFIFNAIKNAFLSENIFGSINITSGIDSFLKIEFMSFKKQNMINVFYF